MKFCVRTFMLSLGTSLALSASVNAQMLGASLISTSTGGIVSATYGNFNYVSATSGITAANLYFVSSAPVLVMQNSVYTSATGAALAYLDIRDSAGNEYGWMGDGSGGSNDIGLYASAGNVNLGAGGRTLMTLVSATGNVGIGTTTPSYNFHVLNTKSGGTYTARFDSYNGSGSAQLATNSIGLYASSSASNGYGLYGYVTGSSGIGVNGATNSTAAFAGLLSNTGSGYYCFLGTGSYSIQCSGPTSGISDGRLKKDVTDLDSKEGLAAVMQLRPVSYRWKDERKNHQGDPHYRELGFIAQDVEKVLPELVGEVVQPSATADPLVKGKIKSLEYDRLAAPIVKAIQELKVDNDNLRAEFDAYKQSHP